MIAKLLKNDILVKSLLTMFVQGLGQISAFFTAILLARYFQVFEYGQYIFGVTIATIVAVIATLGADGILARSWGWSDLASSARNKETFFIHNWYWRKGMFILCIVAFISLVYINVIPEQINWIEIFAFCFAVPFFLANLLQSYFVAIKKVIYANIIQLLMRLIMLACVVYFFMVNTYQHTLIVMVMLIGIFTYTLLVWLGTTIKNGISTIAPVGSNLAFMLLKWGNLLLSQIDIVLLKIFSTNDNIAYYGVAIQLSALIAFVLNAVSSNIMAQVASDYKKLSKAEFQIKITSYTKVIVSLSLLGMVFLIISGYWICQLYGASYVKAYYIFAILMIGQAVNVLCGSVFTILNMAGFEKLTCKVFYQALAINIILGSFFVYLGGPYGVAIASVISMIYWNIYLTIIVIRKVGINPTLFFLKKQLVANQ